MDYLLYSLMALTIFGVYWLIIDSLTRSRREVKERLETVKVTDGEDDDEMKKPFVERAIKPIYDALVHLVTRFTPEQIKSNYNRIITQAGLSPQLSPIRLLVNQLLVALLLVAFRGIIAFNTDTPAPVWQYLALAIAGLILPWLYIKGRADSRSKLIRNNLPDFLDMLYVSVEAGLAFDSAMKRTAEQMPGPLSEEIIRALDDIAKGRDREETLRGIGQRSQVKEVSAFVTAVIQSELLGSNIANMLRIQSNVLREGRRQRAEQEAARMSTKMLFPMIFFMFPAMFVVILGPAILNIIATLGNVG